MSKAWSASSLGSLNATPGAIAALADSGESFNKFLARYARGEWGEISDDDREANEQALKDGSRIMGVYKTAKGVRLWVITEAEDDAGVRQYTTILLPEEY